jgi:glycosyltransferase involved in cell wall biosynthesis
MNVLHLTLSFAEGGRRRAIATLASQLRAVGVSSDLCCVGELGSDPREPSEVFGSVESLCRRSIWDDRALRRLTRISDQRNVEIVHSHDAASQVMAAMLRVWRPHLRLLMTFHRSLGFESSRFRDRFRNALAAFQCGAIVTGSRERREHFLTENYVTPRKVIRIPFGIDTTRFRPNPAARSEICRELAIEPGALVIGAIGHFRPEKGLDRVIRGFAVLCRRPLPVMPVLVIVGDGTPAQRSTLHALARETPPGRIIFAGYRRDVERWLQACDIFVHTPRLEAFGLVVAEAMASRLPVVATPVGGILDLLRNENTGIFVSPDSPTTLADAFERLLSDATLREKMGRCGQETALAEYGMDLYARRYLHLYKDLMAHRPPRGIDDMNGIDTPRTPQDGNSDLTANHVTMTQRSS